MVDQTQLYMKYLGVLQVLKRARIPASYGYGDVVDDIDAAMGDAATFLEGRMEIRQSDSGEWWVEPVRSESDVG